MSMWSRFNRHSATKLELCFQCQIIVMQTFAIAQSNCPFYCQAWLPCMPQVYADGYRYIWRYREHDSCLPTAPCARCDTGIHDYLVTESPPQAAVEGEGRLFCHEVLQVEHQEGTRRRWLKRIHSSKASTERSPPHRGRRKVHTHFGFPHVLRLLTHTKKDKQKPVNHYSKTRVHI